MSADTPPDQPKASGLQAAPLMVGPLVGRSDCVGALRAGLLAMADDLQSRHLLWRDQDFQHWPLDESAVLDALARWLRLPGRNITLLGADFEGMARQHPRFLPWRRMRAHAIHVRQPADVQGADLGGLLLGPTRAVQWLDKLHWRGRIVDKRADLADLHQKCDALLQQSEAAWPVTTLGL